MIKTHSSNLTLRNLAVFNQKSIHSDQIGRFLNVLGNNFSDKSGPNFEMFWVYLKYTTLKSKTVVNAFGANFEKIGLLLIPISAHTDKRMSTRLNVDKYVQIRLPFEHFSRMKCHCVGFTKEGFKHYCSAIMQCYDM